MDRILVVDDAELNRDLLYDILKDDYTIDMASDGVEALEKLRKYRTEISALLLDLRMPKLDGLAVIEEMRQNGWIKRIPVLIISGEHAIEIENRCFYLGVSDFIHKPFESSIVINRVKNAIELFACKNQLEQTVEKQALTLKKQDQIIQMQAKQLRDARSFKHQ